MPNSQSLQKLALEGVYQVINGQHQFSVRLASAFAKADDPALVNFIALVKWIDPETERLQCRSMIG